MNLNRDSNAYGIIHLEPCPSNESILGADKGGQMAQASTSFEARHGIKHPWKDKVFFVEWRTKDQSNVKVYDQKRTVDYADYKVGLFYISPFDLFVEGEPVIMKLERKKSSSPSK